MRSGGALPFHPDGPASSRTAQHGRAGSKAAATAAAGAAGAAATGTTTCFLVTVTETHGLYQ